MTKKLKWYYCVLFSLVCCSLVEGSDPVAVTEIQVFAAGDQSVGLNRGDQGNAIDGEISTGSYLTPPFNDLEAIASMDLAAPAIVSSLRVAKFTSDTEANGGTDRMKLIVLVSGDTGPLNARSYVPVSHLQNGVSGMELINAEQVLTNGTIIGDTHSPADGEFWSVSFVPVAATAVALQFDKLSGPGGHFVHYPVTEFQIFGETPNIDAIRVLPLTSEVELSLTGLVPGFSYAIQRSFTLTGQSWTNRESLVATQSSQMWTGVIDSGWPKAFWRIGVESEVP